MEEEKTEEEFENLDLMEVTSEDGIPEDLDIIAVPMVSSGVDKYGKENFASITDSENDNETEDNSNELLKSYNEDSNSDSSHLVSSPHNLTNEAEESKED